MTVPGERLSAAEVIDLSAVGGHGGVVWSVSPGGFHTNLVVLDPGESIAAHRNDELDVLVVVLAGAVSVDVDGSAVDASASGAVLVPRGTDRSIAAGEDGARYLTIHAPRAPLSVTRHEQDEGATT